MPREIRSRRPARPRRERLAKKTVRSYFGGKIRILYTPLLLPDDEFRAQRIDPSVFGGREEARVPRTVGRVAVMDSSRAGGFKGQGFRLSCAGADPGCGPANSAYMIGSRRVFGKDHAG